MPLASVLAVAVTTLPLDVVTVKVTSALATGEPKRVTPVV